MLRYSISNSSGGDKDFAQRGMCAVEHKYIQIPSWEYVLRAALRGFCYFFWQELDRFGHRFYASDGEFTRLRVIERTAISSQQAYDYVLWVSTGLLRHRNEALIPNHTEVAPDDNICSILCTEHFLLWLLRRNR